MTGAYPASQLQQPVLTGDARRAELQRQNDILRSIAVQVAQQQQYNETLQDLIAQAERNNGTNGQGGAPADVGQGQVQGAGAVGVVVPVQAAPKLAPGVTVDADGKRIPLRNINVLGFDDSVPVNLAARKRRNFRRRHRRKKKEAARRQGIIPSARAGDAAKGAADDQVSEGFGEEMEVDGNETQPDHVEPDHQARDGDGDEDDEEVEEKKAEGGGEKGGDEDKKCVVM